MKSPNLSVSISHTQDSLRVSMLNVGLLSNIYKQRGLSANVISSIVQSNMDGAQLSTLGNIVGGTANGIQISGLFNAAGHNSNGVFISGLTNATRDRACGVMIAGISNLTGVYQNGVTISGLTNIAIQKMNGLQLSAIANIVGHEANGIQTSVITNITPTIKGAQLSAFSNVVSEELNGFQFSPLINITRKTHLAMQWAGAMNVCTEQMNGVQMGFNNFAGSLKGTQIGLVNICCGKTRGLQLGILNYSQDSTARNIGLVNISPHTRIQYMQYGGNTSKINLAVRFRNDVMYYILGFGTHYLGLNDKFSGCMFYRVGAAFHPYKRWMLSADGGYYHIENFENEDADTPERMYSLQLRANVEYQISRRFSIFASGGYGWTRYYDKNRFYQKKPIVEIGIILF